MPYKPNTEHIIQSIDADDCIRNIIKANMKDIIDKVNKLDLDNNDIKNIAKEITTTIEWTEGFKCGKSYTNIPEEAQLCNIIADIIDNPNFCNSDDLI
ncbi:hypothetical protein [Candidatus Mesenet endosymbiont of Phosphuga atrata]|uniref:hypothetical protein n=1 Tax=Candidatus Mesenet endosymbiont of Phosphuga atrata TaxID=3066221 RepID=UPI0030CC29EA